MISLLSPDSSPATGSSLPASGRAGGRDEAPDNPHKKRPARERGPKETLDIAVIDVPTLRLNHRPDRQRLVETVERIRLRLIVLDPLVRLHGVDENTVAEVAPVLGFLRDIQRRFETAVLLVHHPRKSGATRPGQALRGSSELHAWGDSNLYPLLRDRQFVMTVEHRAASGLDDIEIELADDGDGAALRLRRAVPREAAPAPETTQPRILHALAQANAPLSQRQIRERAATQPATVAQTLQRLVREGRIERAPEGGYRIADNRAESALRPAAANCRHRQDPLPPLTSKQGG